MAEETTSPAKLEPPKQRAHLPLHSAELDQLLPALLAASGAFPEIERTREVTVRSDRGTYTFKYAPLDTIAKAVNPPLRENGLIIVQTPVRYVDGDFLRSVLYHKSGQFLASEVEIHASSRGTSAQYGAALTYSRRYGESALLNLTTETDNDDPDNAGRNKPGKGQARGAQRETNDGSTAHVTAGQERQLRQAIIASGRKEDDVVAHYADAYGIRKLKELPASAFDRVMAALKKPLPRTTNLED